MYQHEIEQYRKDNEQSRRARRSRMTARMWQSFSRLLSFFKMTQGGTTTILLAIALPAVLSTYA